VIGFAEIADMACRHVRKGSILCLFLIARLVFPTGVDVNSYGIFVWLLIST
jgi:hypothetical protein